MQEIRTQSCWNCAAFDISGGRFVNTATCRHAKVVEAMKAKGVEHLDGSRIHRGCKYFTTRIKNVPLAKPKGQAAKQLQMF